MILYIFRAFPYYKIIIEEGQFNNNNNTGKRSPADRVNKNIYVFKNDLVYTRYNMEFCKLYFINDSLDK